MSEQTLSKKMRNLIRLALRFGVIGVSTIVLYFICLNLLHPLIPQVGVLAAICYAITTVYNYLAQSYFTFQTSARSAGTMLRYLIMHGVCMALNSVLMVWLVETMGLALNLAQLCVTVLIAGLSFVISYLWVYRPAA